MKREEEVREAMSQYSDTIYRVSFLYMKNHHDVEDIFQDVFLKYALRTEPFESTDHERAWLIRVAINLCKDKLKNFFRRNVVSLNEIIFEPASIQDENKEILTAVLKLPEKYRIVIYMVYYEGYTAVETAKLIGRSENTVYTWLSRGKNKLKEDLGGDFFEQ